MIGNYAADQILWFADEMNELPRKYPDHAMPAELFEEFPDHVYPDIGGKEKIID